MLHKDEKATHVLYSRVTICDRSVLYLYGPEVGRHHDVKLLRQSGLHAALEQLGAINNQHFSIYDDSAPIMHLRTQIAFNRHVTTALQVLFIVAMTRARQVVAWSYEDVKQEFTTIDFFSRLKVPKAQIALIYKMGVFL